MANKLKAILFDYDGTLRDSISAVYAAYEHAFAENELPIPDKSEIDPHIHHHSFVHKALAPDVAWEDFEDSYKQRVDTLLTEVKLYNDVKETLAALQADGYKIGLVTAAKDVKTYLEQSGINHFFDVVVSAEDLTKHKPDPQGINIALDRLNILPEQAIYVGDMATDMYAAQAAKLRATVGVTHGFANRRELQTANADHIIDSLSELTTAIAAIEQN